MIKSCSLSSLACQAPARLHHLCLERKEVLLRQELRTSAPALAPAVHRRPALSYADKTSPSLNREYTLVCQKRFSKNSFMEV